MSGEANEVLDMVASIITLPQRAGGWLGRTARRGLWFGMLVCA